MKQVLIGFSLIISVSIVSAQSSRMDFENYNPTSTLVVPQHKLTRAKYPFIDVHNHQPGMPDQNLQELVNDMNKLNMAVMVNLSGQSGATLKQSLQNVKATAANRFIVFANINCSGIGESNWT